ncbi:hypothetical protein BCR41DRAFT_402198 [Lobosporangium transversale]|uniref:Uncharacterized protein n=1 Tax=Lobosporangium transversale TaxID=64571 RepID=A0A1Y2G5U6_9FUNG|nr:hypothetical protein BCR41DRAFT_402198 [Lobosporangium transversale]ORY96039.1 hypothetical protein BCR41DRAFT_402198 [Lobosporangium transversale]|eukprot:XP_021875471.1 hypothetical protein BCR41DRAFT_402198 [Lobosporangium transversale]
MPKIQPEAKRMTTKYTCRQHQMRPYECLKNGIHLHFLCEYGDHSINTSESGQNQILVVKHDGYDIRKNKEFIPNFEKHMFILLLREIPSSASPIPDLDPINTEFLRLWPNISSHLHKLSIEMGPQEAGAGDFQALMSSLKANITLTTLNLKGYHRTIQLRRKMLWEAFKVNMLLTTVKLRGNLIMNEGAQALSEGLKINTTLTTLDLLEYS